MTVKNFLRARSQVTFSSIRERVRGFRRPYRPAAICCESKDALPFRWSWIATHKSRCVAKPVVLGHGRRFADGFLAPVVLALVGKVCWRCPRAHNGLAPRCGLRRKTKACKHDIHEPTSAMSGAVSVGFETQARACKTSAIQDDALSYITQETLCVKNSSWLRAVW